MINFDIAIIGGGPAGTTLARLLDKKFRVVLIDGKTNNEDSFHKCCGGLLSTDAQKSFAEFDLTMPKDVLVDPQIFSVRTIDLQTKKERHYQRFYINMDRHKFDMWLDSLIPANVEKFSGRCKKIEREKKMYFLSCKKNDGTEQTITAKIVIGADGGGSMVRKYLYPKKKIRRYTAIQQWFKQENSTPFYSCIFDPTTSDCCSWSISKDNVFIYGGAFEPKDCRMMFEIQKQRLMDYGFRFGDAIKTEACVVLRPKSPFDICLGKKNAFLIGEAAGLISPSSLEGISFAINSARILAKVLNTKKTSAMRVYKARIAPMKMKIFVKLLKCPFMYVPALRKIIMNLGINSIKITKSN